MLSRQPGLEPIPGFRLSNRLGRGGFGEVWKATAPGGTQVALKFIPLAGKHGLKEFRGLQIVKNIRHANLLPLIAIWLIDERGGVVGEESANRAVSVSPDEIVIAMSLGDKSLSDRLKECKQAGQVGIPARELLDYLEDAAKAIDFLNRPQHDLGEGEGRGPIIHGDIKPQNILIVGSSAQVCDFGLARMLADAESSLTGVTPAYASPEQLTDGRAGRASDQYALAITYHELRTGRLPFAGSVTAAAMVMAHLDGKLELDALPVAEQRVIRRATAREPQKRYPSCQEMVQELRNTIDSYGEVAPRPLTAQEEVEQAAIKTPTTVSASSWYPAPSPAQGSIPPPPPPPPVPPAPAGATGGALPRPCGEYTLLQIIGQGAMGIVYRAQHGQTKAEVAIKVLPGTRYANRDHVQRLLREALLGTRLRHPNLCSILTAGTHDGDFYVVMEYLDGITLRSTLEGKRVFTIPQVARLGEQLIDVLAYLSAQGVVHRDVKPANVMLVKGNHIKLMDLGLAKNPAAEESRLTMSGFIMGTPAYMSPEQIQDASKVTWRSDLYAAGATLYEMLTGKRPHESSVPFQLMRQVLQDPIVDPQQHRPDLPGPLARLLLRLLDKSPDARPSHAEALETFKKYGIETGEQEAEVIQQATLPGPAVAELLSQIEKVAEAVKDEIKDPNADELLDFLRKQGGACRLGNYVIEERLGPRAPISTYRAYHYLTKIKHLVRVLPPAFGTLAEDQLQALLDMQGQLQKVSMSTPQLCTLVEVNMAELPIGTARAVYYTAEDFLAGTTIESLIKQRKRLELKQTKYCLRNAILALQALHRRKLVHGNVHPGKCYLNGDGKKLLLADLSRARRAAATNGTTAGQADVLDTLNRAAWMGNPYAQRRQYLAPEIIVKNAPYDFLAEQYALGVTFIEALTGDFVRTHQNDLELMHFVHEDLEERLFEIDDRSVTLGRVLRRMVATKPQLRYQDLPSLLVTLTARTGRPMAPARTAANSQRKPYAVFISYRRDPDAPLARLIKERLEENGFRAFLDVEGLDSGPFPQMLLRYIEEAPHFVPIFSPGCLDRCKNLDDWLRREIIHAVQSERNIVPVYLP
jgi:serine/threonine protein kinase